MIEPFWVDVPRDQVRVWGPDTVRFLQGQLSQEVTGLSPGAAAWSFLLQPQGKVDAWLRVVRVDDDEYLLDVDAGFGDAVIARLERFKLRTKAELALVDVTCIAVRGARAPAPAAPDVLTLDPGWPGVEASDLLGPGAEPPAAIPQGTLDDYEALRIECGVPAMGRELTARTIPAEAGVVERSVSFTKGCFTGQELVARIDSRGGNVPRRLRAVVVPGTTDLPAAGAVLEVEGKVVGELTSTAWSPRWAAPVALAYVKREVEPPAPATLSGKVARIEALPLLRSEA